MNDRLCWLRIPRKIPLVHISTRCTSDRRTAKVIGMDGVGRCTYTPVAAACHYNVDNCSVNRPEWHTYQ